MLERMHPPTCNSRCFVGPYSHKVSNISKKVLEEHSDVVVGTLRVGNHVTTSSSWMVLYKRETERWGNFDVS